MELLYATQDEGRRFKVVRLYMILLLTYQV